MNVPVNYSIIDKRNCKEFKQITYCGYKKVDVLKEFANSLLKNNLEIACNWMVELHISGKNNDIWNIIFITFVRNINIKNPNFCSWVWLKYERYIGILKRFNKGYEYESRNNQEIRNLYADIITTLLYASKTDVFLTLPKIPK